MILNEVVHRNRPELALGWVSNKEAVKPKDMFLGLVLSKYMESQSNMGQYEKRFHLPPSW
jgi:hypothetical protein